MTTKQERLNEVYEYVHNNCGVHTKTDFALSLQITRPALSSALNGKDSYLTKNLFQKICAAYPDLFNLDYLLTGNGSLLKSQVIHDDGNIRITEEIDPSSLVNAALAAKDETIAALRENLDAKDQLIASLRQQIEILKKSNRDPSKDVPMMVADNPKV
jgi:hypothetical protein